MSPRQIHFPYIPWLLEEGFRQPYSLTMSGMSAPDPAWIAPALAGAGALDLAPPMLEAEPALRSRLAELFGTGDDHVLLSQGASGAMHQIAWSLFPGAHVVTELPSYEPFRALSELYGASWTCIRRPSQNGQGEFLAAAEAALAGRAGRPGHLFLCNPHNPSGHLLDADTLRALAQLAAEAGGLLIVNESYMEFAQPRERLHAFTLAPNALSLASLTKAYGLGALRCGWILLADGVLPLRATLADRGRLTGMELATPSLRVGRAALDRLPELLAPLRALEHHSRPHLVRWLEESAYAEGSMPRYGLCAFPRIRGVDDTRALARHLGETQGVGVVPGEYFGAPGHLRVSFALPEATLSLALERLERGIAAYLA